MSTDNKQTPEEVKRKCPFNGDWCGDWCPLLVRVNRVINGIQSHATLCVFIANHMMISEINMKTQLPPQQKMPGIQLPGNIRGN